MQGIIEVGAIPAEIPPGGMKKCSDCKQYLEVTKNYSTTIHTLKDGRKKRYWRARCRDCTRVARKAAGHNKSNWWTIEMQARDRALTRLARMVPELFLQVFIEELTKEYKKKGFTELDIARRMKYRTRYVHEYIRKAKA